MSPGLLYGGSAIAGPPFITNDPDPPEVGQWEIVLPSTETRRPSGAVSGEWTTVDFNYGFDALTPSIARLHNWGQACINA